MTVSRLEKLVNFTENSNCAILIQSAAIELLSEYYAFFREQRVYGAERGNYSLSKAAIDLIMITFQCSKCLLKKTFRVADNTIASSRLKAKSYFLTNVEGHKENTSELDFVQFWEKEPGMTSLLR